MPTVCPAASTRPFFTPQRAGAEGTTPASVVGGPDRCPVQRDEKCFPRPWPTWIARFGASAAPASPSQAGTATGSSARCRTSTMKHIYSSCDVFLKMSEVEAFFPAAAGNDGLRTRGLRDRRSHRHRGICRRRRQRRWSSSRATWRARRAVQRLIDDEELRRRLIANGLKTARRSMNDLTAQLPGDLLPLPPLEQSKAVYRSPGGLTYAAVINHFPSGLAWKGFPD